jgi:DNA ligase D-like protein (predicted 3'-phosphoesterase)
MARETKLREYRAKRNFRRTSEPRPERPARRKARSSRFVIQEHDATAHHYDFRLEVDGVLVSWAVPKGPSLNPSDKRLAIRTEDHPLSYISYEGVIPEGEYGAGPVIVWDTGTYRNSTEDRGKPVPMEQAIRRGHCTFRLNGRKLEGGFALTRMRRVGKREQWLLVKQADEKADRRRNPVSTQPESVLTGRTIRELAATA